MFLKFLGLLSLVISATAMGFYKSYLLGLRKRKLLDICNGLDKLARLIVSSVKDLDILLKECFKGGEIDTFGLLNSDKEILENLIFTIGISNRKREYDNVILCKKLLEKQYADAKEEYESLSKLYRSLGFLGGVFVCIFLI